jgi:hypothetical protein
MDNEEEQEQVPAQTQQNNGFDSLVKYWPIIVSLVVGIYGYADLKEKNYRLWIQFSEFKDERKESNTAQRTDI